MEKEASSQLFETGEQPVSSEQQAEINRLQHGIAVLDLFTKEVEVEGKNSRFRHLVRPHSESRDEILHGPVYKGDEAKLERAVTKSRYAVRHTRLRAMLEHAAFLGIPASLKGKQVLTKDPEDQARLGLEHGRWRMEFATHRRQNERATQRDYLLSRIAAVVTPAPEQPTEAVSTDSLPIAVRAPSINLEERAFRITRAINAMAHRSKLSGFRVAGVTERHVELIWDHYQDGTPIIYAAANNRRNRLLNVVNREFWIGSGFAALQASRMPVMELQAKYEKALEEFTGYFEHSGQYENSVQQNRREKSRKQLENLLSEERIANTKIRTYNQ